MNNDDYKERQHLRNAFYEKNVQNHMVKCKDVKKYAKQQNTFYNPETNTMLYGIDSNMGVTGVSDGTCDQINPLIYTDRYKCGVGVAGANPCVNAGPPKRYNKIFGNPASTPANALEGFTMLNTRFKTIEIIIFLITLLLIIFFGCSQESKDN
jgi:hypothetical protein